MKRLFKNLKIQISKLTKATKLVSVLTLSMLIVFASLFITCTRNNVSSVSHTDNVVESIELSTYKESKKSFTVEFIYEGEEYVLKGNETVKLSSILSYFDINKNVTAVEVSDTSLFDCLYIDNEYIIASYAPFHSDEWMEVYFDDNTVMLFSVHDPIDIDYTPTITFTDSDGDGTSDPVIDFDNKEHTLISSVSACAEGKVYVQLVDYEAAFAVDPDYSTYPTTAYKSEWVLAYDPDNPSVNALANLKVKNAMSYGILYKVEATNHSSYNDIGATLYSETYDILPLSLNYISDPSTGDFVNDLLSVAAEAIDITYDGLEHELLKTKAVAKAFPDTLAQDYTPTIMYYLHECPADSSKSYTYFTSSGTYPDASERAGNISDLKFKEVGTYTIYVCIAHPGYNDYNSNYSNYTEFDWNYHSQVITAKISRKESTMTVSEKTNTIPYSVNEQTVRAAIGIDFDDTDEENECYDSTEGTFYYHNKIKFTIIGGNDDNYFSMNNDRNTTINVKEGTPGGTYTLTIEVAKKDSKSYKSKTLNATVKFEITKIEQTGFVFNNTTTSMEYSTIDKNLDNVPILRLAKGTISYEIKGYIGTDNKGESVNGIVFSYEIVDGDYKLKVPAKTPSGNYTITVKGMATGNESYLPIKTGSDEWTTATITLTITRQTIPTNQWQNTVTAASLIFKNEAQNLLTCDNTRSWLTANGGDVSVYYSQNASTSSRISFPTGDTFNTNVTKATAAGTYYVWYYFESANNYQFYNYSGVDWSATKGTKASSLYAVLQRSVRISEANDNFSIAALDGVYTVPSDSDKTITTTYSLDSGNATDISYDYPAGEADIVKSVAIDKTNKKISITIDHNELSDGNYHYVRVRFTPEKVTNYSQATPQTIDLICYKGDVFTMSSISAEYDGKPHTFLNLPSASTPADATIKIEFYDDSGATISQPSRTDVGATSVKYKVIYQQTGRDPITIADYPSSLMIEVTKKSLSSGVKANIIGSYVYNFKTQDLNFELIDENLTSSLSRQVTLVKNIDYTYSSTTASASEAGTYTVSINGKAIPDSGDRNSNYKGSTSFTWTIEPLDLSKVQVTMSPAAYTYSGNPCEPNVLVTYNGNTVPADQYEIKYDKNVDIGSASVKVTTVASSTNFKGETTANFSILAPYVPGSGGGSGASFIYPTITTYPVSINTSYTGSTQSLLKMGVVQNGRFQYAIGKDASSAPLTGWIDNVPTGSASGEYYIWFKVVADPGFSDIDAMCLMSTIRKASTDVSFESQVYNIAAKNSDTSVQFTYAKVNGSPFASGYKLENASSSKIYLDSNNQLIVEGGIGNGTYQATLSVTVPGDSNHESTKVSAVITIVVGKGTSNNNNNKKDDEIIDTDVIMYTVKYVDNQGNVSQMRVPEGTRINLNIKDGNYDDYIIVSGDMDITEYQKNIMDKDENGTIVGYKMSKMQNNMYQLIAIYQMDRVFSIFNILMALVTLVLFLYVLLREVKYNAYSIYATILLAGSIALEYFTLGFKNGVKFFDSVSWIAMIPPLLGIFLIIIKKIYEGRTIKFDKDPAWETSSGSSVPETEMSKKIKAFENSVVEKVNEVVTKVKNKEPIFDAKKENKKKDKKNSSSQKEVKVSVSVEEETKEERAKKEAKLNDFFNTIKKTCSEKQKQFKEALNKKQKDLKEALNKKKNEATIAREAKAKDKTERKAAEEQAKQAKLEAERKAAEEQARQAKLEAERKAAEEQAKQAKLEAERKAAEEQARQAKLEAERKAAEEQARQAKLEAERKAAEEQAKQAKLEAERKAAEEQAKQAKLEAERKVAEEQAKQAKLEAERKAEEEQARLDSERKEAHKFEEEHRLANEEAQRRAEEIANEAKRKAAEIEARKAREAAERKANEEAKKARELKKIEQAKSAHASDMMAKLKALNSGIDGDSSSSSYKRYSKAHAKKYSKKH